MNIVPFATLTAKVQRPDFAGQTPAGERIIVGVTEGRLCGPQIDAVQRGIAADWMVKWEDGTAVPDVRMTLVAEDGARFYVTYNGRADWSDGTGSAPIYIAMTIETADERYAWLNSALFVGKGGLADGVVEYALHQLQ